MSKSLSPKPRQNHGKTQRIFHAIPELPQEWHEHPLHKELLQRRCFDLSDGWNWCWNGDPWWSFILFVVFFYMFSILRCNTPFLKISQNQILLLIKHTPKEIQQTRFTRCSMIAVPSSTELPAAMDSAFRSANHWPPNRCWIHPIWGAQMAPPFGSRSKIATRFPPEKN